MSEYEYKASPRVQTLEAQLIMCELRGHGTKAMLLRGTIRSLKIAEEQESKDLAKFWEKYNAS